jgi:hypothetical protein
VELILKRLVELVAKSNVFAADKYIPFVGTDAPLGMKADAVAVELNDALVPDKALLTNVTVVPSSVIALSPIAVELVNLGRVFVVPVPPTGLAGIADVKANVPVVDGSVTIISVVRPAAAFKVV